MTLVTEKEAAEKWCPLTRAVSGKTADAMFQGSPPANMLNAPDGQHQIGLCIGSRCMAWRKAGYAIPDGYGYCGAFGKVEP